MACEVVIPRRDDDDEDESIAAFVRRRFGEEAVDYLAEPLLAGIHAGDVDRLSMKALFPRLVDAEQKHGSLLRAFRTQNRAPRTANPEPRTRTLNPEPRTPNRDGAFFSLPGGLVEMAASRAGRRSRAAARVRRRRARSAGARAIRRRARRDVDGRAGAARRHSGRAALYARLPLGTIQRAARSRPPRPRRRDRSR